MLTTKRFTIASLDQPYSSIGKTRLHFRAMITGVFRQPHIPDK